MTLPWIKVEGDRLVDEDGTTVVLAGVGLGGWMTMENFITGYPGVEQNMRRALHRVLGQEAYDAFFETFYADFVADDDAAHLASLGMNSVRIPVSYRQFEDDARPFELKESGFARLDRAIDVLAARGLYSIVDLHALPGAQNHHWHSDNPTHLPGFWQHPHFQDRAVHLWEALADRYKDRPEVAGYNPVNEPADETGDVLLAFYDRLEKAVRAVDPRHVLFLDGNKYATDSSVFERRAEPLPNAVYTAHDYALPGISSATEYPGVTRGEYVDRSVVERDFLRRTEYSRRTGTPIWVGETGPMYPQDRPEQSWRYRLLADQLEIYREHGAGWALWTYKDVGLQGLMCVSPESDYLRRIAPSLEQKTRLGLDSWGGSDAGIRDAVIQPLEDLIGREFPGYAPYPWGVKPQVALLVRHILLAEAAVDGFAARFAGVDAAGAAELAHGFRFDRCVERTELSAVLRAHLLGQPAGQ